MTTRNLEPTIQLFIARLTEAAAEFERAAADVSEAQKFIEARVARQTELQGEVTKLYDAGLLLGFDLYAENQRRWEEAQASAGTSEEQPPSMSPPPLKAPPSTKAFKIKDWVLERAAEAYPSPVRAADLRQALREMGHDIHDKTIGMTLYRWTIQKAIRRDGLDWFFIPEKLRDATPERQKEAQQELFAVI